MNTLNNFLNKSFWSDLSSEERILFKPFADKYIPSVYYQQITYEDLLNYLRLNIISERRKNNIIHRPIIEILKEKCEKYDEKAIKDKKDTLEGHKKIILTGLPNKL